MCMYTHAHVFMQPKVIEKKMKPCTWKCKKAIWENLKRGKGSEKWYNYIMNSIIIEIIKIGIKEKINQGKKDGSQYY